MLLDKAVDGGLQLDDGAEDAAPQPSSRELCEEPFDRVEPGTRCWCEVEVPTLMAGQPSPDLGRLVRGVVVQDHVDDLTRRDVPLQRIEKADKLLMPVAGHVLAEDLASKRVERRKQRRRSVAFVIMRHGGGAALFHWQSRLRTVERLYLRLFVDAQHHGVRRRADIETDNVMKLLNKGRILRELELPPAMRREPMGFPNPLNGRHAKPRCLRHGARGPVGRLARRRFLRETDHQSHLGFGHRRLARWARFVFEKTVDASLHEPLLPTPDRRFGLSGRRHDRARAEPFGRQQNDPSAPHMFLRRLRISDGTPQPRCCGFGDSNGYPAAHASRSHTSG